MALDWRLRPGRVSVLFGSVTSWPYLGASHAGWVSPLLEDGGVGVGGAEGEDGAVAHGSGSGGQLGGSLVVG